MNLKFNVRNRQIRLLVLVPMQILLWSVPEVPDRFLVSNVLLVALPVALSNSVGIFLAAQLMLRQNSLLPLWPLLLSRLQ